MSKVSEELKDLATKSLSVSEFYEYSNKIADLVDAKPYKSTKNAKKGYIAVKTRNSGEKETSFAGFRSRVMENIPYKSPASTPDPNKAFADHKYKMWKKKRGLPD
jgi:hypothetical protein